MNLTLSIDYNAQRSLSSVGRANNPFRVTWTPMTSRGRVYAEYDVVVENQSTGQRFLEIQHVQPNGTGAVLTHFIDDPPGVGSYKASLYGRDADMDGRVLLMTTSIQYDPVGSSVAPARNAAYYRPISSHKSPAGRSSHILKRGSRLEDVDRKYCSCLVAVAKSQTPECLISRAWGSASVPWEDGRRPSQTGGLYQMVGGSAKCYNPYAICQANRRRSLGITEGDVSPRVPTCYDDYDLRHLNDAELLALALLHGYPYPDSWGTLSDPEKMSPVDRNRLVHAMSHKQEERRSRSRSPATSGPSSPRLQ